MDKALKAEEPAAHERADHRAKLPMPDKRIPLTGPMCASLT
jgi:hypothetical protein